MYDFVILSCCTIIFLTILLYGPYVVGFQRCMTFYAVTVIALELATFLKLILNML